MNNYSTTKWHSTDELRRLTTQLEDLIRDMEKHVMREGTPLHAHYTAVIAFAELIERQARKDQASL
jgi:hypothetical protein